MGRIRTSQKRGKFWNVKVRKLRENSSARPYDPTKTLSDPRFIQKAITEAMLEGDVDAVRTIYKAHLRVLNRAKVADELRVSRQHVYRMMRDPNPRMNTFVAFMGILKAAAQHYART